MALSLLAHVRRGYRPKNAVLVNDKGEPRPQPVGQKGELRPGLLVYRFNHSMYYANAAQLSEEVSALAGGAQPKPRWFCFDMAAVNDVDYSAAQTLRSLLGTLQQQCIRPVFAEVANEIRTELERYGILKLLGTGAVFVQVGDVVRSYEARLPADKARRGLPDHA
jgi:SulP family sulfate permease